MFPQARTGIPFPGYRASGSWVPGASNTEIATIVAGARRFHLSRVWVSASQQTNATLVFRLHRKTADNQGGTSSDLTTCKHENLQPDAT